MRILITGAAGFIGSHTVDYLHERKHEVLVVDNFSTGKIENIPMRDGLRIAEVDITKLVKIDAVFDMFRPDAVLHLAAQSAISTAWTLPEVDLNVNAKGTLALAMAANVYGVKKFVFSSTAAVYGKTPFFQNSLNEKHSCHPDTPYGISKLAAEQYIRLMFPNHVILRYANIYGPRQVPIGENQVVARAFRHYLHGDDFKIVGDGEQKRDFVYVGDIVRANYLALTGDATGTFNAATGTSHSVNQVLSEIERVYGVPGYKWEHTDQPDERGSVYMSGGLIKRRLGWKPYTSLREGITMTAMAWEGK